MTTDDHKWNGAATRDGSKAGDPESKGDAAADRVAAHHDAAFYHESAAFHHRQAAQHMANGRPEDAERHVWAAFGHSLNAHESTRAGVSALRGKDLGPGRGDGPPSPGESSLRAGDN